VPFEPNPAQLRLLGDLHTLNLILKARQLGFTTLCCLIYLDACVFTPHTRAGVIAHRLEDPKVIFRDKIKFPYDRLDEGIRAAVPAVQDSADTLTFRNNSSIRVSTSMRSGTLQYLHVSEFGKICARAPEKAREIVTGALNTVESGQFVVIESTAEGQEGAFYEMTQRARERALAPGPLTPLDYRFHFFPWWEDAAYQLADAAVTVGSEDERYFERLEEAGIQLTLPQKRWWVKKTETLGGDMKREYPATPDEAFEQALEGAYFAQELFAAAKQGRIGGFPYDPRATVQTFWDLGRNDLNTIWLHQHVNGSDRFIGYYENSGEFVGHYVEWLREWAATRRATFGDHYIPHDGDRESLWLESGTKGVMSGARVPPADRRAPAQQARGDLGSARGAHALRVRRTHLRPRPQAAARLPQGVGRAARGLEGSAPARRCLTRSRRLPDVCMQRLRAANPDPLAKAEHGLGCLGPEPNQGVVGAAVS
jgi:hypothetical protein